MNWNCRFAAALGAFVLLAVTTALDAQTAIARPWRMTAESQQVIRLSDGAVTAHARAWHLTLASSPPRAGDTCMIRCHMAIIRGEQPATGAETNRFLPLIHLRVFVTGNFEVERALHVADGIRHGLQGAGGNCSALPERRSLAIRAQSQREVQRIQPHGEHGGKRDAQGVLCHPAMVMALWAISQLPAFWAWNASAMES